MRNKPLLSIYIPLYNHGKVIEHNLSFMFYEIRKYNLINDVEVSISDNASNDDTQTKVEKLISLNSDLNIKYSRNPENIGGIKNIMNLWQKTTGDYVIMIGDDCFSPSAIANILDSINKNKDADIIVLKNNTYYDFEYNSNATNLEVLKHVRKLQYIGDFVLKRSHFESDFVNYEKYFDNAFPHLIMIIEKLSSAKKVIDTRFVAVNMNISWNYDLTTKVVFKLAIDCLKITQMMRSFIDEESYKFLLRYYNKSFYKDLRFIRKHKDRFYLLKYIWNEIPVKNSKVMIALFFHSLPAPLFYSYEVINMIARNARRCFKEIVTNQKKWKTEKFKKYQDHVSDDFGIL